MQKVRHIDCHFHRNLALLAGVLYFFYLVAVDRARRVMAPLPVLAIATAAGAAPLLLLALALGEPVLPGDWTPVILLSLSSQLLGQGLLVYAMGHLSPVVVGLCFLTQPALSAAIGWAAYDESFTLGDGAGALLICVALVLIRLPDDAIRSLVHRNPGTDSNRALARWIAFYRAVERVRDEVVITSFEQVTAEFGSVVERLNARFGCRFETGSSTAGYREKVFAAMERDNADRPAFAAVPDARRSEAQNRLALGLDAKSLREAHALYRRLTGEPA
mgnify:CR=1 FL=1